MPDVLVAMIVMFLHFWNLLDNLSSLTWREIHGIAMKYDPKLLEHNSTHNPPVSPAEATSMSWTAVVFKGPNCLYCTHKRVLESLKLGGSRLCKTHQDSKGRHVSWYDQSFISDRPQIHRNQWLRTPTQGQSLNFCRLYPDYPVIWRVQIIAT